jgi:hypothetical protein
MRHSGPARATYANHRAFCVGKKLIGFSRSENRGTYDNNSLKIVKDGA